MLRFIENYIGKANFDQRHFSLQKSHWLTVCKILALGQVFYKCFFFFFFLKTWSIYYSLKTKQTNKQTKQNKTKQNKQTNKKKQASKETNKPL